VCAFFYSKTNQIHNTSDLFYFGTTLYMFQTVFPSITRSLRLYIQHQIYVIQVLWPLASKRPQNLYGMMLYDMIQYIYYLLTAVGLSPGGSTRLHTNNTQNNTNNNRTKQITTNVEDCGPCHVFAGFTLAFALQLRKKHGKTSVRVRKTSVK
jgi:hypothetical protein